MKQKALIVAIATLSSPLFASNNADLQREIQLLQQQTKTLQAQLDRLQKRMVAQTNHSAPKKKVLVTRKSVVRKSVIGKPVAAVNKLPAAPAQATNQTFHTSSITIHAPDTHPESFGFYPTALIAGDHVVTYIAGTPVISSPYLGDRPAFDGSDYIVNISSINRDIRLMQQRRQLYLAYESIGYPAPQMPIIALSGKTEPEGSVGRPYFGKTNGDFTLGSSELDVTAILNADVEAFMSIAYDESPPDNGFGQRLSNSAFNLNQGFVNIGNLERTPFYFTAGQLFAPFGRYSSSMISSPLTMSVTRTKTRPFIVGYKSQQSTGPFAAVYAFKSDTTLGHSGIGGVNLGYIFKAGQDISGEIGGGYIGSIADSQGLQDTGSSPFTTFGGFASPTNGSESVRKVPGVDIHGNVSFDRYSLTAEWVSASRSFRVQDLSFNGRGAKPQAAQIEGGVTFMAFHKPASLAAGYQWSKETLALNLPKRRVSGVFNISLWKDTVESIEYRHDYDFSIYQFGNGASSPVFINANTVGTGKTADTVTAQIGVYF